MKQVNDMTGYKYGNSPAEEIRNFKWFCKTRLGYNKQKWFHLGKYTRKMSEVETPTFVNEKTQLLWSMWKAVHREVWVNYGISNSTD